MKVLGIGFERTGTQSLKAALEQLGFGPCCNGCDMLQPEPARMWRDAAAGKPVDWEKVFAGYQATVDWPAAAFWEQLVEAYPEAKVVLTVRDLEHWYESASNTIFAWGRIGSTPSGLVLSALIRLVAPEEWRMLDVINRVVIKGIFAGRIEDKQHVFEVFDRHVRKVTELVPRERLLVYDVRQGWEPLAAFLGVSAPDTPFPHLNDTESFQGNVQHSMLRLVARRPLPVRIATAAVGRPTLRRLLKTTRRAAARRP